MGPTLAAPTVRSGSAALLSIGRSKLWSISGHYSRISGETKELARYIHRSLIDAIAIFKKSSMKCNEIARTSEGTGRQPPEDRDDASAKQQGPRSTCDNSSSHLAWDFCETRGATYAGYSPMRLNNKGRGMAALSSPSLVPWRSAPPSHLCQSLPTFTLMDRSLSRPPSQSYGSLADFKRSHVDFLCRIA